MRCSFKPSQLVPNGFLVDHLDVGADWINLIVRSVAASARCPSCATPSCQVQSRYRRRTVDPPPGERRIDIQVVARRFFCEAASCTKRIFAERFPAEILPAFARRTARLEPIVHYLGLALGGRPAAGLARRLVCRSAAIRCCT